MAEESTPYVLKMPITSTSAPPASSPANARREWLVILPDHEGALEKRLSVRQKHLENLKPKVDDGLWVLGGAILSSHPQEGQTPQMKSSVMLAVADSKEEVIEQLKKDIYSTSGVWNWDRVEIVPFKSAIRKGM